MPDVNEYRTPAEYWLDELNEELTERARVVDTLERYYCGDHPIPDSPGTTTANDEARHAARRMARMGITNWVKLVADAPAERLEVVGFRFGEQATGDMDAWRIWQAAQLDADSGLVHHTALKTGQAFVLVWPAAGGPEITVEHPAQTIIGYEAGSRRRRSAALKRWIDDDEHLSVTVYLPDALYKYRSVREWNATLHVESATGFDTRWEPRLVAGEEWPLRNRLGVVPVVEFRANATLEHARFGGGSAEFDGVLSIQDRINKTVFDRMTTAEHQAFRQRYVIGWTDEHDKVVKAGVSRMLTFEDENVKVGELGQADFTPFIKAVESDVQAMAAITKTPPHYLLGQMVNISGDALKAAEAGLVAKVKAHARNFGESWEEVMRLALAAGNDPRADDVSSMVVWGDMESRTWAETVDAVMKMSSLGVPQEALWLMLPDVTPQDVQRWKTMQGADILRRALTQPALGQPGTPVTNGP